MKLKTLKRKIKMKASEINECVFGGSMLSHKTERQHYKELANRGHLFPTTKQQAKYVALSGIYFDVLGMKDVEEIDKFFAKFGYQGNYVYTKNKSFVRLTYCDNARFFKLLAEEYGFIIPEEKE